MTARRPAGTRSGSRGTASFKIAAVVRGDTLGIAWGRTKKDAEQRAAKEALRVLRGKAQRMDAADVLPSDSARRSRGEAR